MAATAHIDDLTVNEAAHLAGVSVRKVEKSCEEGIVHKKKYTGYLVKREVFHVPVETVVYTAALKLREYFPEQDLQEAALAVPSDIS